MPYINNYGNEEQKQEWLPRMIAGDAIGCIVMMEPGAGSDLAGMRINAKEDGDNYIINDSEVFIMNGWMSDVCIICAKTDPDARAKEISLFLINTKTPGYRKGQKLKKMGMKAQETAELFFDEMRVPKSALLGELNKSFISLMTELPQERPGWRLPRLATKQLLDSQTASMAKGMTSDLQNIVAGDCVQLHGGWGYMWEYDVCRAYVDGKAQPTYGGTNEIMVELVARAI